MIFRVLGESRPPLPSYRTSRVESSRIGSSRVGSGRVEVELFPFRIFGDAVKFQRGGGKSFSSFSRLHPFSSQSFVVEPNFLASLIFSHRGEYRGNAIRREGNNVRK